MWGGVKGAFRTLLARETVSATQLHWLELRSRYKTGIVRNKGMSQVACMLTWDVSFTPGL